MIKIDSYKIFLFLSTFVRGLIEVFSCVLLYKMHYQVLDIFIFIIASSFFGIISDYISIHLNYKIVFILSSILYGISFYFLSVMDTTFINLLIFSLLISFSNYSYTIIKHLLALNLVDSSKKSISVIMIFTYIGSIISSIVGAFSLDKFNLKITSIIIIFLSLVSIIPIWNIKVVDIKFKSKEVSIPKDKILFSILEQFKVIFITLEPLYLYINVRSDMYYIGLFSVIVNIASLFVMYKIGEMINNKYFKYLNIIFCVALILKLNISNSTLLLLIAFLEGVGQKIYEIVSLENLYSTSCNYQGYLMLEEVIFCISRIIIMLFFYFVIHNLDIILYIYV